MLRYAHPEASISQHMGRTLHERELAHNVFVRGSANPLVPTGIDGASVWAWSLSRSKETRRGVSIHDSGISVLAQRLFLLHTPRSVRSITRKEKR